MDLGVAPTIHFLGLEIPTEVVLRPIGCLPGIAMGFLSRGDLAGCAAQLGIDDEDLRVALLVVASPVASPGHPVLHHGGFGELGPPRERAELDG